MATVIEWILVIAGQILVAIGVACDIIAAILMLRFQNFYLRLHALTIGSVGGAFVPMIGVALIAAGCEFLGHYRWFMVGAFIVVAMVEYVLASAGTHAIARAAYRSKAVEVYPKAVD
ncbi:MAG TPA: cation:proton antiporter, partial [Ignisphaera aggregans]|nr:cation:proton antiporter [Ignisphaera aggregans]